VCAILFVLVRGRLAGEEGVAEGVIPPIAPVEPVAVEPAAVPSPVPVAAPAPAPEVAVAAVPEAPPVPTPPPPAPAAPTQTQPEPEGTPEVEPAVVPAPGPAQPESPGTAEVEPVPVVPGPVPEPPPAPAPQAAARPQYDPATLLGGVWKGTALNFPIELRFSTASAELVRGEALFFAGTSQSRVNLTGTLDPGTGTLQLRSADGRYKFEGRLRGQTISGTYQQGGGKLLEWKVSR
jgi:hypothetical protein